MRGEEIMIELLPESRGCLVGFQFIGEITGDDYTEDFMPALRRAIENFGVVRLFVDISDLQSEDIGAMDDNVREESRVLYIERQAIVGDEEWERKLNYVDHFFLFANSDVRFFRKNCEQDAWDWIHEGMPQIRGMQAMFQ
jgi:hypothetical protein